MEKSNLKKLRMALAAFVLGALTMSTVNGVNAETYVGSDSVTVDAETKEIKVKNMTQVEKDATGADVYSLSLGRQATANGQYALAVGYQAQAGEDKASAFGYQSSATAVNASAVGSQNQASGVASSAVGYSNEASGAYDTALGYDNQASGTIESGSYNVAVGSRNIASGEGMATAVGYHNTASNDTSSAFGYENTASGASSSAIGTSNTAEGNESSAVGYNNEAKGYRASSVGMWNEANVKVANAFGYYNVAAGEYSTAVGVNNKTNGSHSSAVGRGNTANGDNSSAFGRSNEAAGIASTAVGYTNKVYGGNSAAFGYTNTVGASGAETGAGTYVFGASNTVTANNAIVVGTNVATVADNSVVIGDQSTSEEANTVSVGYTGGERKIVHVADGTVNTDVATYGQIAKEGQEITLSTAVRETVNEKEIKGNEIAANDGTVLATFTKVGETLTATDTGFVSGADLYKEVRPTGTKKVDGVGDYEYIDKNKTTAENLVALDSAIAGNQYQESDTISIAKADGETAYTVKVKNMAQSTSDTDEETNGTTKAQGENAVAFGVGATAMAANTQAFGTSAVAGSAGAIAIGKSANATVSGNTYGLASGYTTAIGYEAVASGTQGTALGYQAIASGARSLALGQGAEASHLQTTAVGSGAAASGVQTTAVGLNSEAGGAQSTAVGFAATASGNYSIALGGRYSDTSAGTKTLTEAAGDYAVAIGNGAQASKRQAVAIGWLATASSDETVAIGRLVKASGTESTAIGGGVTAAGAYATAIGNAAEAAGKSTVALGSASVALGESATALGNDAKAYANYSVAIGRNATVGIESSRDEDGSVSGGQTGDSQYGIAIGDGSQASAFFTLALGPGAYASGSFANAIGYQSYATARGAVAIGMQSVASVATAKETLTDGTTANVSTVSFGHQNGDKYKAYNEGSHTHSSTEGSYTDVALSRLTNVVEGKANTDAVNFSQIKTVARSGDDEKNGVYIQSSLTDGALNADGTVGKNLAALDAKAVAGAAVNTVTLSTDARDDAKTEQGKKNEIVANDGTVLATFTKMENVSDTDTGFVSGVDLYAEVRPEDGFYVKKEETTATNLSALDTKIGEAKTGNYYTTATDSVESKLKALDTKIGEETTIDATLYAAADDVETQISKVAGKTIKSVTDATADGDSTKIQTATLTKYDTTTETIQVEGEGAVASGDVRLINGDTVYRASVKSGEVDLSTTGNKVYTNGDTTNALLTFTKMENVSDTDTGFVSGADLYKEVRPTDGDIVKNGKTTAENLKALEEALAGNTYQGSDTISIAKAEGDTAYTVKVKNMAMSEEVEAAAAAPTAEGLNAIAFGVGAKASGDYAMVLGHGSEAEGEGATALGSDNNVKGQYSVAIGTMNTASSSGGTTSEGEIEEDEVALNAAIGAGNYATGPYYSTAVGVQNSATAAQAVAFGYYNQATGEGASAVGGANTVGGMYATAVGASNVATGQMATAIGYGNQAVNNMSMAIGTSATSTAEGATAIGYQAAASVGPKTESGNTVLTVSFGHDPSDIDPTTLTEETPSGTAYGTTVLSRLIHVADGKALTDAANFGQIAKTGQTVNLGSTTSTVNGKSIKANQVASNNGTVLATFTKVGDTLTETDTGFVSGADLYKEVRPVTSTNYVSSDVTTAANLSALDEKIGEAQTADATIYADTDDIETQIYKVANTRVAKGQTVSLGTTSGTNATNVIKDADGNVLVTMAAGTVSQGNHHFVSGGQVWANDVKNQSYDVQGDGTVTIKNNANGTAFTITGIGSGSSIVIGDGAESAHWVDLVWNGAVDDASVTRGMNSAAYGYQANASGEAATALGYNAQAIGNNSVALGSGSVANEEDVVSVGGGDIATRRIVNVANGTSNSDAATYGQTFKATTVELTSTKNTISSHDGETKVTFKTGAVSNNNTGFISGGQLYTEGRVKGSEYNALDKANTIAQNLEALDEALGNNKSVVVGDEETHALDISWNQETGEAAGRGTNSAAYGYGANASGEAATAIGYNAKAGGVNSVALGAGSVANEDNVISVGGGDVETRKIVNVAYGTNSHDAAAVGQLIASTTDATSTDKTKAQTATLAFKDMAQDALTIEVPGQGTVDANDQRLVSGATLYGETRNAIATTNQALHYVSEQDAASNLLALDKAIGKTTKGNYISAQDGDAVTVATNLDELDKALKAFDEDRNNLVSYNQAAKEILIGAGVNAETISARSRRITNVTAGTADTDAVNKKQLDTAIAGTNYTSGDDYVTVDNAARTISVDVAGSVSSGNPGIVTGGTVYNAVVKNATYSVNSDKKTVTVKNGANQTAFTLNLDGIAGEGVTYEAGDYVSISDANKISVDVAGSVSSGNTGIVTGGTVYNAVVKNATYNLNSDKKTVTVKNGANQTAFTLNLDGIAGEGVTYEAGDYVSISDANKISVDVAGSVSSGNAGIVTGGTVYNSIVKNATYGVNSDKKTVTIKNGANQTAFTLDLSGLPSGGTGVTYGAGDHISISSDNKISVTADGTVAKNNSGLVTGGTVYDAIQTQIGQITPYTGDNETITVTDKKISAKTGAIGSGVKTLITGDTAYQALVKNATYSLNDDKKTITVKNGADQTAFTLNLDGLAGGSSVTYEAGDNISISSDDVISVKTDGKIERGNTGIVTGGAIYEKVGDTAKLSEAGLGENLTDSVLNVNSRIGRLDSDISKAGAGAAALAALRPEAFNPADKVSFALGYGHYRGTSAGAFGAFYKPNADTTFSVGATIGNSDSMMNAGISFKLGSRGQGLGLYSSNADLVRQVNALRVDNELLKADNARMKQQIALILANMEMSGTVKKSVTR